MNKKSIALFVGLILVITNPNAQEHREEVRSKAIAYMKMKLNQEAKGSNRKGLIEERLDPLLGGWGVDYVSRDTYILFSLTTFTRLTRYTHEQDSKVIGLGILGNVFLFGKIEDALKSKEKSQ